MRPRLLRAAAVAAGLGAGLLAAGCGGDDGDSKGDDKGGSATTAPDATADVAPVVDPGDGGNYDPEIDPASFVDVIDNPYLPLSVGSRWVYEGESDGEVERIEVVVTGDRKEVMGISAFVIRDTVSVGGEVVEDTLDWFAQDADGNVWYLGEESKDYEDGEVVSTKGSWEAGVDGALPGIVMPAEPAVGDAYRQEFYAGEAEDMMEILEVGTSVEVPAGNYDDVLVTEDWNPLEPDVVENKYYARGVGVVREEKVGGGEAAELVEFTPGS